MTDKVLIDPRLYSIACVIAVTFIVYLYIHYIAAAVISLSLVFALYVYARPRSSRGVEPEGKAILITGCDTGFGNELAKKAHEMGFTVFAGCLNGQAEGPRELEAMYEERMHVLSLDVTNDYEIASSLEYVNQRCGHTGLWGLVNNAGVNAVGPIELCSSAFFQNVANVNLFGAIKVTKTFLPLIRQAQGRVVNVSSERGLLARGNSSVYCMTKYGLEAFSDSLRHEMKRFGVKVSVIEPGHFGGITSILSDDHLQNLKSQFYESLENASEDVVTAYPREMVDQMIQGLAAARAASCSSVGRVIDAIVHALVDMRPQTRYLVSGTNGFFDRCIVFCHLKNILPDNTMDYLLQKFSFM